MVIRIVMVVLSLIGVLALLVGLGEISASHTVFQETATLIILLIGVVGLGFAAMIGAILRVMAHVERGFAEVAIARRERGNGQ
jgi:hypothetical protein